MPPFAGADPGDRIVRVGDPSLGELNGVEVVVTQVRVYQDGSVRYGTGSLADANAGGIYDEASLRPAATVASVDDFRAPGPFLDREVVEVSGECPEVKIRGQVGEIDGSYFDAEGALVLGVWFETLHESWVLDPWVLRSTGRRRDPPSVPRTASSKLISEAGVAHEEAVYTVVDDITEYL